MKFSAIIVALFAIVNMASAQVKELKKSGTSAEEMLPEGWKLLASATDDINHDFIPDLVLIALPDNSENIITRDDGYEINKNEPVVAVYFGSGGEYQWWGSSIVILEAADEYSFLDNVSVSINAKGVVRIGYKMFYSAGSWGVPSHNFVYRYQDDGLYLIGYDSHTLERNTLNEETVSYNFLTHKKQTVIRKNGAKKAKEIWEIIPAKPLLGFDDDPHNFLGD